MLCKIFLIIVAVAFVEGGLLRKWEYSVISVFTNSSDESIFKMALQASRLERGNITVSGSIETTVDIGDNFKVSWAFYHSKSGVGEFTKLPYSLTNMSFRDYMNNVYKNYIMKSMLGCSDSPQFKGKWIPPIPKGHYYAKNCILDTQNMSMYMYGGYVKIAIWVTGPANVYMEVMIQIMEKL